MAMDEAVMVGLRSHKSTPVLRVYKWAPPTVSIGYFQPAKDIDFQKCRQDGIGIVRRLTGGRAVLHYEELTYSIIFTEEDFTPFRKKDIFIFIAQSLVDSLKLIGIHSRVAAKTKGNLKSPNCFASPAQFEIESLQEGKLIGSAQVIKEGVVLQHGAIPLTQSYTNIEKYLKTGTDGFKNISSLNQASGFPINDKFLLLSLKDGFSKHLSLIDGELNDFEISHSKNLAVNKYSTEEWMFRK
jgi:lipoate-protein ligase A